MTDPRTRYTDQQMALILNRAAELQAAGDERRYTLEEIQAIAQQVGIEPEQVAVAAAALPAPNGRPALFGAPSAYRLSRRISATSQPVDEPTVIATIRDHMPAV